MAVISLSDRLPARKRLCDVACAFSVHIPSFYVETDIARITGLTETEVTVALDCVATHGGVCTIGDIEREFSGGLVLHIVMALVGAGVLAIDMEALRTATANAPVRP